MGARENLMAKLNVDNEQLNEIIKKKMAEKKCSATQALILLESCRRQLEQINHIRF